jgi:hypothetical protein
VKKTAPLTFTIISEKEHSLHGIADCISSVRKPNNEAMIIERTADFFIEVFDRKSFMKRTAVIPYSAK